MNILDLVLLLIMAAGVVHGLRRGAIRQLASVIGVLAGFMVAGRLYLQLLHSLPQRFSLVPHLDLFCFLALVAATWLAIVLLGRLAVHLAEVVLLRWADRLLGSALGLLKGVLIGVVLVATLTLFLPRRSPILARSLLAPGIRVMGRYLVRLTPAKLRRQYSQRHAALLPGGQSPQAGRVMEKAER